LRIPFLTAAVAAAGILALSLPARAIDLAYQLNPAHDGQVKFAKPFHGPLKRRWSTDLGGKVSPPLYADGRVFVSVVKDGWTFLDALDSDTGEVLWEVNTLGSLLPAYDNGRVYVVSQSGLVQAYNAQDGSVAWTEQQSGQSSSYWSSPVAAGGGVYFHLASSGTLYSRAGKTGTLRWDAGVSGTEVLPAVAGSTVFTAAPCLVIALDAKTGDRRWTYDTGCSGGGGGMPIYFEGRIYVNDGMESVVLDAAKGKKLRNFPKYYYPPAFWTNPSGNSPGFLLDGTGRLHAFDTVTGRNLWNSKRHRFDTPPLVISDTVVIGSGFRLYGLDTRTGAILWSQDTGTFIEASFPNGPIGLGAGDGKVFIPNDTAVSAWGSPRQ